MLVAWSDTLSVGHPTMDAEHQKLVGMVNELHDAMKAGHGREAEGKILKDLVAYTVDHFGHEERMMAASGYPKKLQHVRQHQELVKTAASFVDRLDSGKPLSTSEVIDSLVSWLKGHILGPDKELGAYLTAKKIAA